MTLSHGLLATAAIGLLGSGCCTDVEKKLNSCLTSLSKEQAAHRRTKGRAKDLAESLADAEKKLAKYKEQTAFLTKRLESLGQKVADVQSMSAAQKAAMEARLAKTRKELNELRRKQAQAQERLNKMRALLQRFAALIKSGKVKVAIRDGRMVVVLASKVLFDSGRTKIRRQGRNAISEITEVLKSVGDRKFQVAGHTDDTPIRRGRYKSNWELSTARAVAVVKLMQKLGMNPEQLSATGYGEYSPVKPNTTKENKAENRRIEIVLQPKLDELPSLEGLFNQNS